MYVVSLLETTKETNNQRKKKERNSEEFKTCKGFNSSSPTPRSPAVIHQVTECCTSWLPRLRQRVDLGCSS